jgi:hypothetical protein
MNVGEGGWMIIGACSYFWRLTKYNEGGMRPMKVEGR